jgi:hypothetical protein
MTPAEATPLAEVFCLGHQGSTADACGVYSVGRRWDTGATEDTSYAGSRVGAVRGVGNLSGVEPEIGWSR